MAAPLQSYVKTAPTVYRDKQSLESTFKSLHGPRVLILATHGYFLRDQLFDKLPQTPEGRRALASLNRARLIGLAGDQVPFVPEPLLRCGLALAGANEHHRFRGANDGILTGLEILGTDLHGTELVVLDACERASAPSATARGPPACTRRFTWPAHGWWSPASGAFPPSGPINS